MIRTIRFQEYRALRDVTVALEPLTVFVGPNGSGKTSLLSGVDELLSIGSRARSQFEVDAYTSERLPNTSVREGSASIEADFAQGVVFKVTWRVASGTVIEVPCEINGINLDARVLWEARGLGDTLDSFLDQPSRKHAVRFLRLVPQLLGQASYSDLEEPILDADGGGLAAVLTDLAGSAPEILERITEAVMRIVPSVRRIRTERAVVFKIAGALIGEGNSQSLRKFMGNRVILDTTSGTGIPLSAASEGTALTVALMTVLYGRHPPTTLLMDDLDRALHPAAQRELVTTLRAAMKDRPELQILATTHSPYLLDALEHREVRLTTLAEDGSVRCAKLESHPEFERWKDMVTPGELWTSKMESWVADGAAK